MRLDDVLSRLAGRFDNAAQLRAMTPGQAKRFPFAEVVNSACNGRIRQKPEGFSGVFLLSERFYTTDGRTTARPQLFLLEAQGEEVRMTLCHSPLAPGELRFGNDLLLEFPQLRVMRKFVPLAFTEEDGAYVGRSVSALTPAVTLSLAIEARQDALIVRERQEENGDAVFGFDGPIELRRPAGGRTRRNHS